MLKWFALITMFVDHLAILLQNNISVESYTVMRVVGRLSFPLFAYMVLQGSKRTSNINKYFIRAFSMAIVSQVVIDGLGILSTGKLNTMFSLSLYVLVYKLVLSQNAKDDGRPAVVRFATLLGLMVLSQYGDYGVAGFVLFVALDVVDRLDVNKRLAATLVLLVFSTLSVIEGSFTIQFASVISGVLMFIPELDQRVFSRFVESRLFYLVYPVHFFILYLIKVMIL